MPFLDNPENFGAQHYLALKAEIRQNPPAQSALDGLIGQVKSRPQVAERLSLDLLNIISQKIQINESPRGLILDALQFGDAIRTENVPAFLAQIESIIRHCFGRLREKSSHIGVDLALDLTASIALTELRKRSPGRFEAMRNSLVAGFGLAKGDDRWAIISRVGGK